MAANDPGLHAWRDSLGVMGSLLVDHESNATVELARTGCLTGGSAATWIDAEAAVAMAWTTYRSVDELLDKAEKEPSQAARLLTQTKVPGPDGPTDPTTAMQAAKAGIESAVEVTRRLSLAWDTYAARVATAKQDAETASDASTASSADALAHLIADDPLAVTENDITEVETKAQASKQRHASAQAAVSRIGVDLDQARSTLKTLASDLESAATELAHAADRIAGLAAAHPIPDLAALGEWLDRIAQTASTDKARAASTLADWQAAAKARRDELDGALGAARRAMERREQGRGLYTALRAKAGARRLDEQPDVTEALEAAKTELWKAPCDLDVAETALARLSTLLEKRGKR